MRVQGIPGHHSVGPEIEAISSQALAQYVVLMINQPLHIIVYYIVYQHRVRHRTEKLHAPVAVVCC